MTSHGNEPQHAVPDESRIEICTRQFDDGLSFNGIFNNSNPVEVEIGSGRGRFIIQSARDNPQVNYIGIERA
jgi:tRNA G46 methylase TrmB